MTMINKECIVEYMLAATKEEALAELAAVLPLDSLEGIVPILMEREKLGSTGIGDGIAVPHGKIPGLDGLLVSFGRSRKGIAFGAVDGKPVHLIFLFLLPDHASGHYLKILAKISSRLKDDKFKQKLIEAISQEELFQLIVNDDANGSLTDGHG